MAPSSSLVACALLACYHAVLCNPIRSHHHSTRRGPTGTGTRLLSHSRSQTHRSSDRSNELWLDDLTKDFLYDMQGDSPVGGVACPAPPKHLDPAACKAVTCTSDLACNGAFEKCCSNGCVLTCGATTQEPPVVDWIREPPRILKSGYSWLVPTEQREDLSTNAIEWCTTSVLDDDEDALLCPHGYMCHIEDPGDEAAGKPNRGRCIKASPRSKGSSRTFQLKVSATHQGACIFKNRNIENHQRFSYDHHRCTCREGEVECIVSRRRPSV